VLDRLPRFHQHKGRRRSAAGELHGHARPLRDRAIAHVLLGTGLRREELVNLDLDQVTPNTPDELHAAKKAKISGVRGKGATSRTVFLGADGRTALADYLEHERPTDTDTDTGPAVAALFLSAASIGSRRPDGRLSPRSINLICEQIGRWHDAEHTDPARHISPLRPHDLRTRSPSRSPRPPAATPTNSSAGSATSPSGTSTATPTHPRTSPPATSSRCDRRRLRLVTRFLPAPHAARRIAPARRRA